MFLNFKYYALKEFNISIADTKGFKSITSIALSILNKEDGNFLPMVVDGWLYMYGNSKNCT